jgi:hypothetical protein
MYFGPHTIQNHEKGKAPLIPLVIMLAVLLEQARSTNNKNIGELGIYLSACDMND